MEDIVNFFKDNTLYCLIPLICIALLLIVVVLLTNLSKMYIYKKEIEAVQMKNTTNESHSDEIISDNGEKLIGNTNIFDSGTDIHSDIEDELDNLEDMDLILPDDIYEMNLSEEERNEIHSQIDEDFKDAENIAAEIINSDDENDLFTDSINEFSIGDGKFSKEDDEFIKSMETDFSSFDENKDELDELNKMSNDYDELDELNRMGNNYDELEKLIKESHSATINEIEDLQNNFDEMMSEIDKELLSENTIEPVSESGKNITESDSDNDEKERVENANEADSGEDDSGIKYLVYFDNSIKKWVVRKEDAVRASKKFNTRAEAVEHAGVLVSRYGGTIVKLRKNGVDNNIGKR